MSTHNIGFYEDLTKIIFELSSNIIMNFRREISTVGGQEKYFLCCKLILYIKSRFRLFMGKTVSIVDRFSFAAHFRTY